jgi:hypothetical protein
MIGVPAKRLLPRNSLYQFEHFAIFNSLGINRAGFHAIDRKIKARHEAGLLASFSGSA